jgi:hypothetical protein
LNSGTNDVFGVISGNETQAYVFKTEFDTGGTGVIGLRFHGDTIEVVVAGRKSFITFVVVVALSIFVSGFTESIDDDTGLVETIEVSDVEVVVKLKAWKVNEALVVADLILLILLTSAIITNLSPVKNVPGGI